MFLTSSVLGLASVATLDGTRLPLPEGSRRSPPLMIPRLRVRVREKIAEEAISGNPGGGSV